MKPFLLELWPAVMPALTPLVWAGGALAAASLALLTLRQTRFARMGGGATMALGVFFLACQIAGDLLGARAALGPGGPAPGAVPVPLWEVGLALFVPGGVVWAVARSRRLELARSG